MRKYYKKVGIKQDMIDDDIILYNEEGEVIVALNETATIIWCELDGKSYDEIRAAFLSHYVNLENFEYEMADDDLREVLRKLVETGCVVYTED